MEQFRLDPRLRWLPRSGKERGGLAREGGKTRVESVEGERRVAKRREDGDMGERERERETKKRIRRDHGGEHGDAYERGRACGDRRGCPGAEGGFNVVLSSRTVRP